MEDAKYYRRGEKGKHTANVWVSLLYKGKTKKEDETRTIWSQAAAWTNTSKFPPKSNSVEERKLRLVTFHTSKQYSPLCHTSRVHLFSLPQETPTVISTKSSDVLASEALLHPQKLFPRNVAPLGIPWLPTTLHQFSAPFIFMSAKFSWVQHVLLQGGTGVSPVMCKQLVMHFNTLEDHHCNTGSTELVC